MSRYRDSRGLISVKQGKSSPAASARGDSFGAFEQMEEAHRMAVMSVKGSMCLILTIPCQVGGLQSAGRVRSCVSARRIRLEG